MHKFVKSRYLLKVIGKQCLVVIGLYSVLMVYKSIAQPVERAKSSSECVVLLHGLARSDASMKKMADSLEEAGYVVVNQGYPSREASIPELAELAVGTALERCPEKNAVHFVTHSLGGILVRQYLATHNVARLQRVVMLGPPNQGSEVVDRLAQMPGFTWVNGKAGHQLGTDADSVPNQLAATPFTEQVELGVIAGDSSINWILSMLIPGDDDGKVAVDRTALDGMKDHIVMPVSHPFLMKDDDVITQVLHFLAQGQFEAEAEAETE